MVVGENEEGELVVDDEVEFVESVDEEEGDEDNVLEEEEGEEEADMTAGVRW